MGKLWCNEELAARAKAGNKEAFALLWAQNRRHIYYLAVKYRSIIEENAFVDLDDFMQCGYLALVEAVNAFDPEKGFALTSYINFKYKQQVYAMFGNVREGDKRIFPQPCSSLNAIIENDKDGSGRLWAYYRQLSGSEFYASAMVNAAEEVVFTVNHRTDVTTEMLVEYGGKFYDIKRIDNYEGYTDDISLYCKLSNDQNIEVTEPDAASV